jgi:type IV secretory pathway VirB6-like protein
MTFFTKIKWILGVLLVFVLILATNLIDKDNFRRVKNSIVTIYEDRLVVNDLIFELSQMIHQKELAAVTSDSEFFNGPIQRINEKIDIIIEKYLTTKLTEREEKTFGLLQDDLQELRKMEVPQPSDQMAYREKLSNIKDNLHELTKIQLREGRNQMAISKEAIKHVELFTRIEIYLLIFLAIAIQVIIIYTPKKKSGGD